MSGTHPGFSTVSTTAVGGVPPEEVLATAPAKLSTKVPDDSHVPPAAGEYSTPEAPLGDVSQSSTKNVSSSKLQDWDYAQKGGGDFDMEAPISEEDMLKAGGLGARDELDSFLPAAVDATDYEESLKDAMEYEDVPPEGEDEVPRPGVGFVKSEQQIMDGFRDVQQE